MGSPIIGRMTGRIAQNSIYPDFTAPDNIKNENIERGLKSI